MRRRKLIFSHHLRIAIVHKTITKQELASSNDFIMKGLNLNYEQQQQAIGLEYRGRRCGVGAGRCAVSLAGFLVKISNIPALPNFLSRSGSGTGSTQPL
jgi:hypothetical protein